MQKAQTARLMPLRYLQQDSPQTLAEGLAEYYAANVGRVTPPESLPSESSALFRSHDVCHVVFGLDTTLADETLADTRTLLSCDVGARTYAAYLNSDPQVRAVFRETGWAAIAWTMLRCLPRILRAAFEALRMRKRWPWVPPDSYRGRSLADLRAEYGIRLI
jgi:hypothetical protein